MVVAASGHPQCWLNDPMEAGITSMTYFPCIKFPSLRNFSTPRRARDLRFEPLAPSALALTVHQQPSLSVVSSRNGKQLTTTLHFAPPSLCWSMAFPPSETYLPSTKS